MEKVNKSISQYIGKIINCFEVLEIEREKRPHSTAYKCKCIYCGKEFVKSMGEIKKYKQTSCTGCLKKLVVTRTKQEKPKKAKKFVGYENKAYKVIDCKRLKNHTKFVVQCKKCGDIHMKYKAQILNIKGDGCNKCTGKKGIKAGDFYTRFYNDYSKKIIAEKRRGEIEFKLSKEEVKNLINGNCYYCGNKPQMRDWVKTRFKEEALPTNGIDRINPNKGYIPGNCVSCCPMCNYMKIDYNINDFKNQIYKIYHNLNLCSTTIENTEKIWK
jgi:hypothetical protein